MILVLADDMTGALEVAAVFADSGFRTIVSTKPLRGVYDEVLVIDTETRHSSPSAAFERVVALAQQTGVTPDLLYKKTDSTLRGNIRSELMALAKLYPEKRIGYAPAYPAQGRVVKNGVIHVNGVPLAETAFARDCLNPVVSSSIRDLIGPDFQCTIFDGSTDLDVQKAAAAILADQTMRIAAGPAALAEAIAAQLQRRNTNHRALPRVRTCIVMNGSRTEISRSQIRHAESHCCLVRNGTGSWSLADPDIADEPAAATVAAMRAEQLIRLLRQRPTDGVLIIGGDTAYAFLAALGSPPIVPITQLVPGVAISRISNSDVKSRLPLYHGDLILITKAGGFGEVDVLCRIRQILEQDAQ
jgi:uncharacterized protein YgbK (DUF1537 family)